METADPTLAVYRRVRQEWQDALAAYEAGDGDPVVLALRLEAARQALNACIRALKSDEGFPLHDPAFVLPWMAAQPTKEVLS